MSNNNTEIKKNPYVVVDVYAVETQSFSNNETEYYIAEVNNEELIIGQNEDPFGIMGYGETEQDAKNSVRAQLKECGFSKKQIKYKRTG